MSSMSVALSIREQNKKKKKLFIAISIIIVAILVIAAIGFKFYFVSSEAQLVNKYTNEYSKPLTNNVNNILEDNFTNLDVIRELIVDSPELALVENLNTLFSENSATNSFKKLGYVYPNGSGYDFEKATNTLLLTDYSGDKCIKDAYKNSNCTEFDPITNDFTLSIPVKNNEGEYIGSLMAQIDYATILAGFHIPSTAQKSVIAFAADNGDVLFTKPSGSDAFENNSILNAHNFQRSEIQKALNKSNKSTPAVVWTKKSSLVNSVIIISTLNYNNYKLAILLENIGSTDKVTLPNTANAKNSFLKLGKKYLLHKKFILLFLGCAFSLLLLGFVTIWLKNIFNKRKDRLTMKWALYDEITDGYNKQKFYLEVSNAFIKAGETDKYAMILLDIDNFKTINQIYDMIKGNSVLKDISNTIKWFIEKNDIYARIMSDNFAVLLKYKRDDQIISFVENVTRAIGEYKLKTKLLPTFGIYKILDYNMPIDEIINKAQIAKQGAKANSEKNYMFFTDEMANEIKIANDIENEMFYALNQKQYIAYLQPKYDTLTGDIVGSEVLARWVHPEKGLLLPEKFIKTFESNGFVTYLDQYILEESCRTLRNWLNAGVEPLPLSINISRLNLNNPRFAQVAKSMLEMYSLPTKYIIFEIAEDGIFENINGAKRLVKELKEQDFQVSLDRFGKNYSALNIVNEISFDYINFSKEFIDNLLQTNKGKTIIESINTLAKSTFSKTTAIGIDSPEKLNAIKDIGIDMVQGFELYQPLSVIEFENLAYNRIISGIETIKELEQNEQQSEQSND